jgi:hypothetical protein
MIVAQGLEGLLAIGGDVDVMPALRQQQLQDFMRGRAVFRDQDPASSNEVWRGFEIRRCSGSHPASLSALDLFGWRLKNVLCEQ